MVRKQKLLSMKESLQTACKEKTNSMKESLQMVRKENPLSRMKICIMFEQKHFLEQKPVNGSQSSSSRTGSCEWLVKNMFAISEACKYLVYKFFVQQRKSANGSQRETLQWRKSANGLQRMFFDSESLYMGRKANLSSSWSRRETVRLRWSRQGALADRTRAEFTA